MQPLILMHAKLPKKMGKEKFTLEQILIRQTYIFSIIIPKMGSNLPKMNISFRNIKRR